MTKIYSSQHAASWINENLPEKFDGKLNPTNLTYILDGMAEYMDEVHEDEDEEFDYDAMLEYVVDEYLNGDDIGLTVEDLKMVNKLDDTYCEKYL